jgi:hypothetical protein
MNKGTRWIIGISAAIIIFLIFGFTVPVKTQAYTDKEIVWVTEKYIEKEPYEVTEEEQVPVKYTYTAPCEEKPPRYGYKCCEPLNGWVGSPGGRASPPTPGDPAYNPYMNQALLERAYIGAFGMCEYEGIRWETRTRTVTKVREVEKTRIVPTSRTVTKYRTVPLFSCAPLPS